MYPTLQWNEVNQTLDLIDQTKLPQSVNIIQLHSYQEVAMAIKTMQVRGAPAIGITAAWGLALAAIESQHQSLSLYSEHLKKAAQLLKSTRPTAVNLFWAIDRILQGISSQISAGHAPSVITQWILHECREMTAADIRINRAIGKHGARLLKTGDTVLTHCNAGSLATVQYGTALAPIRWAIEEEKKQIAVIADETRPWLQGARLTAWELHHDGIPVQVACDNTAALLMQLGKIQKVFVGADRVVQDAVFNKIGTYMLAITASYHHIPFYVAAPSSSLDLNQKATEVTIEQRDGWFEVAELMGRATFPIVPVGVNCINYSFDSTPLPLITAFITEDGVFSSNQLLTYYGSKEK